MTYIKTKTYIGANADSAEVAGAARKWILAEGYAELYRAYWGAATELGINDSKSTLHDRFCGQVKRALDNLAGEGMLIKVGRGERMPGGHYTSNVFYFTPEKYKQAQAEAERKAAEAAAIMGRWETVHDALASYGIENQGRRGEGVSLSLGTAERLTRMLDRLTLR